MINNQYAMNISKNVAVFEALNSNHSCGKPRLTIIQDPITGTWKVTSCVSKETDRVISQKDINDLAINILKFSNAQVKDLEAVNKYYVNCDRKNNTILNKILSIFSRSKRVEIKEIGTMRAEISGRLSSLIQENLREIQGNKYNPAQAKKFTYKIINSKKLTKQEKGLIDDISTHEKLKLEVINNIKLKEAYRLANLRSQTIAKKETKTESLVTLNIAAPKEKKRVRFNPLVLEKTYNKAEAPQNVRTRTFYNKPIKQ